MDFIDEMRQIGARIPKQLAFTKTEEATKHAMVLPFIHGIAIADLHDSYQHADRLKATAGFNAT